MYALVSGQAGLAVLVRGGDASVLRVQGREEETGYTVDSVTYFLRDASDIERLSEPRSEDVVKLLRSKWSLDRIMRLVRAALNEDEDDEGALDALSCVEDLLSPQLAQSALTRLCIAPVSTQDALLRAIGLATPSTQTENLLKQVLLLQGDIEAVRAAWDGLPTILFEASQEKVDFESAAAFRGVFGLLAEARHGGDWNAAMFDAYNRLADQKNHRAIVAEWTRAIGAKPARLPRVPLDARLDLDGDEHKSGINLQQPGKRAAIYANVMKQQGAIVELLNKGDAAHARLFAIQLVNQQIRNGAEGPGFAAKSLCHLAKHAKVAGLHSLQLEWTERAVELAPADGWAHGQAADAYLFYGRLDDTARELALAEKFGERRYAMMGRARILRAQARFDEALEILREIKHEFAGDENEVMAWSHEAEILRDIWQFESALSLYDQAMGRFPNEPVVRCGRAAVLADLGRYKESVETYTGCIRELGPNEYALSGRAHVRLQLGDFDDAVADYEEAIARYPQSSVPRCGLAEVWKEKGHHTRALELYRDARDDFPYTPVPYSGYAEVLKEQGRFDEALEAYQEGIERFQFDTRCRNGKANLLRLMGKLELALQAYDAVLARFPYDLFAASGRAFILRSMGRLDDAASAYDRIIERRPGYAAAQYGKASVLVIQQRYPEALELLPSEMPRTSDEWIGYHIKGMILLRQRRYDDAINHMEHGLLAVPYSGERRYFRNALATARLRCGEYSKALTLLEERPADAAGKILQLHTFAALRRKLDAERALADVSSSEQGIIIELGQEISRRYGLVSDAPRFDQEWIFERECESVLMAA